MFQMMPMAMDGHDNFAYEEARRYEYQLFLEYENKLKGLNKIEIIEK